MHKKRIASVSIELAISIGFTLESKLYEINVEEVIHLVTLSGTTNTVFILKH